MDGSLNNTGTRWPLDLSQRPRIASCGRGWHNRDGQRLTERYLLPNLWCMHLYRYHARIETPNLSLTVHPGSLAIFPAATPLAYHFREEARHFYIHFRPASGASPSHSVAVHYDTSGDNERWSREMGQLIDAFLTQPLRSEVKLWELLFGLCEQEEAASNRHPCFEKALLLIENRLGETLSPAALARDVGLSHNHLIRLFQNETGGTIIAYIRARRAQRARHLLENTTLPLSSVAAQVGVEAGKGLCDLLKRETGRSPRQLRKAR